MNTLPPFLLASMRQNAWRSLSTFVPLAVMILADVIALPRVRGFGAIAILLGISTLLSARSAQLSMSVVKRYDPEPLSPWMNVLMVGNLFAGVALIATGAWRVLS